MEEVKVYGAWGSPPSHRVEIALKLKGVKYEFIEEDLKNKSEELLKYNPVHKKIPVLVHNGRPIAESLVILEYIDEIWKQCPLLPTDPYDRAQTRFWAKFIAEKITPAVRDAMLIPGEDAEKKTEELIELLHILEKEIKEKKFVGGNRNKYMDIVSLYVIHWIPILQEYSSKHVLTREKFPGIYDWIDQVLLDCGDIMENLPDKNKMFDVLRVIFGPRNNYKPT
uniref:glutathione transferase n=1 Tax=Beta vulgaris TaxID=161934 RepID=Q20CB7_BETVU|nr:Fgenesh protein 133 [Beta vulgaris]